FENQFGFERAFDVQVQFGLGQGAQPAAPFRFGRGSHGTPSGARQAPIIGRGGMPGLQTCGPRQAAQASASQDRIIISPPIGVMAPRARTSVSTSAYRLPLKTASPASISPPAQAAGPVARCGQRAATSSSPAPWINW